MDDLQVSVQVDEYTSIVVSPLDHETYCEHFEEDSLGGSDGYFVVKTSRLPDTPKFEILAKAATFETADALMSVIAGSMRRVSF